MLFVSLLVAIGFAQDLQVSLNEGGTYIQTSTDSNGDTVRTIRESLSRLFSDKFYCFEDKYGMYEDWAKVIYPEDFNQQGEQTQNFFYCCGYMANGRKQCDKMKSWKLVGGTDFTLCENDPAVAYSETRNNNQNGIRKPRRDLCCVNDEFQDCSSCKSFVVWDFTVEDNSFGGDVKLEESWTLRQSGTWQDGLVTLDDNWRSLYYSQPKKEIPASEIDGSNDPVQYPPYAYDNAHYPGGFARAILREFNTPPICVYAPNVAGRVIEVKVEAEEENSQVCVDDLHADTTTKNDPGVTQACDDVRLQSCFPDANSDGTPPGFAFQISCSESCADGDVDLWFRLRASQNRWTDAGKHELGTDRTEVNTEMWCMWGNQNMRGDLPSLEPVDGTPSPFQGLDGDFSKWDVYPSDLEPEVDPQVRPVEASVECISVAMLVLVLGLMF